MTDERRQFRRVSHPIDATWTGASGATRCRLGDVSVGGCFVQTLAAPAKGELTTINFTVNEIPFALQGRVVYAEVGMGFAVMFESMPDDVREALYRVLALL